MNNRRVDDHNIEEIKRELGHIQGKVEAIKEGVDASLTHLRLELKDDLSKHIATDNLQAMELRNTVVTNSDILKTMTTKLDLLNKNTQPLVNIHKDLKGTIRMGTMAQDFVIWIGKLGFIGVAITSAGLWVYEYFKPYIK